MKILPSLVVPNLYEFLSSVEHKRMSVTRQLTVANDFHSVFFFSPMEVNDYRVQSNV